MLSSCAMKGAAFSSSSRMVMIWSSMTAATRSTDWRSAWAVAASRAARDASRVSCLVDTRKLLLLNVDGGGLLELGELRLLSRTFLGAPQEDFDLFFHRAHRPGL